MTRWPILALLVPLAVATPAAAQERDYCPERPGLDTPPCIVDRGHVSVETALADWTRDDQPDPRTDPVLIGDTSVRIGVTDAIEARVGWTPFGHQRSRDKATGEVGTIDAVGEVTLGLKASLAHPDGKGLSIALLPQVSIPVGREPIGAGTWGASLLFPVSYTLSDKWQLEATPEIDAAPDTGAHSRHLAYSGTAGLAYQLVDAVTLTAEAQVRQDNDPDQRTTQALAALSVGWFVRKNWQLDVLGAAGLDRDAPDAEIYAGVSHRF